MDMAAVRYVAIDAGAGHVGRIRGVLSHAIGIAGVISLGVGALVFVLAGPIGNALSDAATEHATVTSLRAAAIAIPLSPSSGRPRASMATLAGSRTGSGSSFVRPSGSSRPATGTRRIPLRSGPRPPGQGCRGRAWDLGDDLELRRSGRSGNVRVRADRRYARRAMAADRWPLGPQGAVDTGLPVRALAAPRARRGVASIRSRTRMAVTTRILGRQQTAGIRARNEALLTEQPTLAFHAWATTLRPIQFVNSRSSVQIRVSAPLPRFVLRKTCYLVFRTDPRGHGACHNARGVGGPTNWTRWSSPRSRGTIGQRLGCKRDWTRHDLLSCPQQVCDGKT